MENDTHLPDDQATVEMPKPTVAPMVLSLGIALLAAGVALSAAFLFAGGLLFVVGLAMWIGQLLPGRGHWRELRVDPALRPQPTVATGEVTRLREGMPGYRLRLPVAVHPVSAGIKGGLVGGLVMPLPAMAYGLWSGHGIWWPVNLLAGLVLPGVGAMSTAELEHFHPGLLLLGIGIHVVVSLILGLMYGVLMPTLPNISKPLAWGALLMPMLWTAVSFIMQRITNPTLPSRGEWPWFIASQFVFGVVAALVFIRFEDRGRIRAGLLGGIAGGLLMIAPATLWGWLTRHGIWYPVNLLATMLLDRAEDATLADLEQFHANFLIAGVIVHIGLSLLFGLAFAIVLPRVPQIPGPLAWGGLLLPLLWTAMSFGLMGIVNPVLQERVDWPWFVVSQFVFGIAAAIVVVRSELVYIQPAGKGLDQRTDSAKG